MSSSIATRLGLVLALAWVSPASAWTRPGHMVTASIAYDELAARDQNVIDAAVALLDRHPDRGPFEVAEGRSTGAERARRLFYECARWPDDARGTVYDQPSWHGALRPVILPASPPATRPIDQVSGDANEAFALQVRILGNRRATDAQRAVALCWVMHLAGDIHQPLHAAELFSRAFPEGDQAGGLQFVRESATEASITLHWFWDDSVNRSDDPVTVRARANALVKRWPRSALPEAKSRNTATDFAAWAAESYPIARDLAYGPLMTTGTAQTAPVVRPDYRAATRSIAERRLTLAGYRIADVLRAALADQADNVSTK